ncbi:unnamed protein product [Rhizoctonia solani]|uniref:BAG domain-containing protein n=1 Tax=Rhizoctonia solani TaxID=456999 RepID=A0A8H3DF13_9AGAM|nr:unnamed protein product [Rhizoctonia solani]CAE6527832.1 unnamed protein product [Rhizoctonia solani]
MSTYRYATAPGYLSPSPAMAAPTRPSAHEDMGSYSYRGRDDASVRSYHSRSSHVKAAHSVDARPSYSYDAKSGSTTFDSKSVYSPDARSVRSTDARPTYSVDARSTHSYEVRSVDARSTYSVDARSVRSTDERSVRSTGARSSRSKSRARADREPQQFLNVQPAPMCRRAASAAGSHRSRAAPSLTHSVSSTLSDDDNESDNGRPVEGLSTPYTAKVTLWRDDVHDLYDDIPPETIIPPHVKARYEYSQRQYGASPSLSANNIPSLVVPSHTAPSRAPSPRSASPPHISTPPSASNSDIGRIVDEIEDIEYEVNSRILDFTFPSTIDFGEKLPNGEFPPLPYTSRNKPLIEHRHYLDKSLLRMDEIHSFNDSRVKSARKRVVTKVQEQLEQLNRMEKMVRDNMHYERWKKTPRIQVTAPPDTT